MRSSPCECCVILGPRIHAKEATSLLLPLVLPPGVYVCAKCGYELFSSRAKYAHSSPWPAFTETIHPNSVAKRPEHNRPEALKVGGSSRRGEGMLATPSFLCSPHSSRGLESVYPRHLASAREAATPDCWESLGSWWEQANRTTSLCRLQEGRSASPASS